MHWEIEKAIASFMPGKTGRPCITCLGCALETSLHSWVISCGPDSSAVSQLQLVITAFPSLESLSPLSLLSTRKAWPPSSEMADTNPETPAGGVGNKISKTSRAEENLALPLSHSSVLIHSQGLGRDRLRCTPLGRMGLLARLCLHPSYFAYALSRWRCPLQDPSPPKQTLHTLRVI